MTVVACGDGLPEPDPAPGAGPDPLPGDPDPEPDPAAGVAVGVAEAGLGTPLVASQPQGSVTVMVVGWSHEPQVYSVTVKPCGT